VAGEYRKGRAASTTQLRAHEVSKLLELKLQVQRPLLKKAGLNARDSMVLTYIEYRREKRRTVRQCELVVIMDCDKGTVSKSFARLRRLGWIDHRNFIIRPLPVPDEGQKRSFVEISGERLRELGPNDALTAAQLQTMHALEKACTEDPQAWLVLPGMVASLIGTPRAPGRRAKRGRDGLRDSIHRLHRGDSLKHRVHMRQYIRKPEGAKPAAAPLIRLEETHKTTRAFRLLGERERAKLKASHQPPPPKPRVGFNGEQIPADELFSLRDGLKQLGARLKRDLLSDTGPPS
jgi:hypothetical protein